MIAGLAIRSFRRGGRIHGASCKSVRQCPWFTLQVHLCRDSCAYFTSYKQGTFIFSSYSTVTHGGVYQTAQAETNNPQWAKAIEIIYPRAREMMAKPRYWRVAFPLTITSLCVAPQVFFLKHWVSCFEISITKLKVCYFPRQSAIEASRSSRRNRIELWL